MFDNVKYIPFLTFIIMNASAFESPDQETKPVAVPLLQSATITKDNDNDYADLETIFERVITLGQNCIPKGHVNAFFNKSQPDARKTKKGHGDLFDWMTIDDYDLFAQAVSNKLSDFFERKDFKIVHTWCELLINKKYNMGWWHLFHSDFEGYLKEDFTNVTEEKLEKVFPVIKHKINYLKEKFIQSKDKKTLYSWSHIK